jgi:predicted metal-dependent HD superfamily phosphohydrolase
MPEITTVAMTGRRKTVRMWSTLIAMTTGVIDTLWTMDDLYDAVMERDNEGKRRERYERLMAKLTGEK